MNDPQDSTGARQPFEAQSLRETLAWVLRSIDDPAQAAGDWIAYEVDEARGTAVALLTDPTTPLSRIRRARVLWSALRAEGESPEERTMGSRLAVAAAACALLFHGERITAHDDAALDAAMRSTEADEAVPADVRTMVRMARRRLAR